MTVRELIDELEKWPRDAKVFVDWDYEGGNEIEADTVREFDVYGEKELCIKIS